MRFATLAAAAVVLSSFVASPVQADPYRWCAEYGKRDSWTSCYFVTYEQCQAAISGVGGFCRQNPFYDGRPVRTPEDGPPPRRSSRS